MEATRSTGRLPDNSFASTRGVVYGGHGAGGAENDGIAQKDCMIRKLLHVEQEQGAGCNDGGEGHRGSNQTDELGAGDD